MNSSAAAFNSAVNASLSAFSLRDLAEQLGFAGGQELRQLGLELLDPLHRHVIHISVLHRPDHRHLDLDRNRVVLRLLEDLHDALAAVDLRLRLGIQFRAELREGRQFPELGEVALELSGDLLHGFDLRRRTDARDREADRNRRAHALVEQIRFQINLAVGDRDDVGGDVSGNVAGLRFDDGQGGERTVAILLADARRPFEQSAVQVKHIAGIGFAARGPLQHQGDLPVGHGVLGQIVEDNQRVHAVVHEPLAHRRAGERRQILVGGRVGSRGGDDDGVGHRAGFFENGDDAGDVGLLLADRDVDAIERAVVLVAGRFGGLVETGLADDRVDADRRLAGRTVADDQFALAAADRDHRVDRHDAGLHRLADRTGAG